MFRSIVLVSLFVVATGAQSVRGAQFDVKKTDQGVTVTVDGELVTRYLIKSGNKPILWPVIGPGGKELTRSYPMTEGTADERKDHVHHRSLWFTHGDVNGASFWHESSNAPNIVHREFVKVAGGEEATIVTRNDWVGSDGKKVCEDERTLVFGQQGTTRRIDFTITIKATGGDVRFGDTKEGTFGVRVAGTMRVDAKKGGRIVNSRGDTNGATWGKQAEWVDYQGPVDGDTVGIAILNHPSSFRFPTYWHVRTYGLFAANPFGLHHFKGSREVDGSHTLKAGESFTLRYRVLLHEGDEKKAKIAEAFAEYAETR